MSRRLLALIAIVGCPDHDTPPVEIKAPPPIAAVTDVAAPPTFGLYVLALSWAPSFCCGHPDKEECKDLDRAFAGSHLTLHGLWPNYSDDEARGRATYPQFCGSYEHCRRHHDPSCEPDAATIPAEMRDLGPGYIGDHDFLANHEWPKHGSCTGLDPKTYFRAALDAMERLPGKGTPEVLHAAIGHEVALADLRGAFEVPATSVLLSCDGHCQLSQISVCLAHDARGVPTTPIPCPTNTTTTRYDNGCVTQHCDRVTIAAANSCTAADDQRPHRPSKSGGRACNHPGQGPSCTTNEECVTGGFLRCARSGCCTSQP